MANAPVRSPHYSLDVYSPQEVAETLRYSADAYLEGALVCAAAGNEAEGRKWSRIAHALQSAATEIEKEVSRG